MTLTLDAASVPSDTEAEARRRFTGRWLGPLAVTALGGVLRFWQLGQPRAVVFDETYYAKDAASLLLFGYERSAAPKADELILGSDGQLDAQWFTDDASFVVHPPFGKWVIGIGEQLFGVTPLGWRFAVALLGTLSILILARAVLRMTGSALWGTVAGLLLAIDGMAIVMSRTAVLDGILAFFVLSAFALLLVDRDWARSGRTPGLWMRPWRWLAAVCLGLACAVKWSALWYVAAFLVLTVLWEAARRRRGGAAWVPALLADAAVTAVTLLPMIAVVYVATWTGWFVNDGGWDRDFVAGPGAGAALGSLLHYHAEMWNFHVDLSTEHSYQSSAFGWLLQARPTSFYYEGTDLSCGADECSAAVTALGNPLIWWAGALALLHQVWRWAAHRDWRAGAVLLGVLVGWAPWLLYPDRTIFAFYSVVFAPFLVAALTLTLAAIAAPVPEGGSGTDPSTGSGTESGQRSVPWRVALVAVFLLACVATSAFFYPIWTAELIDRTAWGYRMWLPTWI